LAFGGQSRALASYTEKLDSALKAGRKKALVSGSAIGVMMMILFCSYGLGFWYGSRLILKHENTGGQILNAFFAIIIGGMILKKVKTNL